MKICEKVSVGLFLFTLLISPTGTKAALEMFLKVDNIPGESTNPRHGDEIEVQAWSWALENSSSFVYGGGGGAGKVAIQGIKITKYVDKATPKLLVDASNGAHIRQVILSIDKVGSGNDPKNAPATFYRIILDDVLVTSVEEGGNTADDRSVETITLGFRKVTVEYWPTRSDGSLDAKLIYWWDLAENRGG